LLGKTHEDRGSRMKVEMEVMETGHDVTTKFCFTCGEMNKNVTVANQTFEKNSLW
jgi:hypothetical protein